MTEPYIAIGDIHGCKAQLLEVLAKCRMFPNHQLIFVGDYIDRGPDTDGVLSIVSKLNALFLKGNHEQGLLNYIQAHGKLPKPSTENRIPRISAENLRWLQSNLRLYHQTEDYLFVHAGLKESIPLDRQDEWDLLWSRYDGRYESLAPKIVVHGHTVVDKVVRVGNRININTGCGFGGPLTALILPEMKRIQSSLSPNSREGNLDRMKRELEELFGQ